MVNIFKLKENNTNISTEIIAGITTFFTMAYIIAVNPAMLSKAGMEWGAVFLATIIASIIGTLVMGIFANVPFAQAPGMGLNAFFVYTVCFVLGFTWQQALSMVFICGLINIVITVTKVRTYIIKAIPKSLQNAIAGGVGIFIAYLGILNVGLINFESGVPALSVLNSPQLWLFIIGLLLTTVLLIRKVKGALFIGIFGTTVIGALLTYITGIHFIDFAKDSTVGFTEALSSLPTTFGVIFTSEGLGSLFNDLSKLPLILVTILAFSLSDTFDTIGAFVGTGRRLLVLTEEDETALGTSSGFKTRMDRALFADAVATSIGAIFGTSNTTTYIESTAGIAAGGRTGLTSVTVAVCFAVSALFSSVVSIIPFAATAPALIAVGIMMLSSFKDIDWTSLEEAIPAFFTAILMGLCCNISYGIAAGFIFYCLIKTFKGEAKAVHPILWIVSSLFVLNFIVQAVI